MTQKYNLTITAAGATEHELRMALHETIRHIKEGTIAMQKLTPTDRVKADELPVAHILMWEA